MMMAEDKTHEERGGAAKAAPQRQCAGCAERTAADDLLRVVLGPPAAPGGAGSLAIDLADGRFGRGAHVHPTKACVEKALRGGFARAFKTRIDATAEDLAVQIVAGADRRIEGLLLGARRAKLAIGGADVVKAAIAEERAQLVVVASDAAAAMKISGVEEAIRRGRAVAWGNKQRLGALFGRDEVAVCAVLHEGVALAIGGARRMALPFADSRSEAWWSSEVR